MRLPSGVAALFIFSLILAPTARADTQFTPADDPVVVSRITRSISLLAEKFPELQSVTLKSGQLDINTYASSHDNTITFNSLYTENHGILERMIITDSSIGYHLALGSCTPEQWLTYHESAHILDNRRANVPSNTVGIRYGHMFGLPLSQYSFSKGVLFPIEALAEAFSSVFCNSGNDIEREFYKILEES